MVKDGFHGPSYLSIPIVKLMYLMKRWDYNSLFHSDITNMRHTTSSHCHRTHLQPVSARDLARLSSEAPRTHGYDSRNVLVYAHSTLCK